MAQKSHFKMQTQGITEFRTTFPQLPWNTVENPTYIQTAHGYVSRFLRYSPDTDVTSRNRLLTSGWWAYSRKPVRIAITCIFVSFLIFLQNYVADWTMSFTWGAVIGLATPIPYFYSVFFITVLIHRCSRDFERYVFMDHSIHQGLTSL